MSRPLRLLTLLLLTACGGGESGPPDGPTNPPPPPATPATIAIQAGDNQEAEPGQPVPIAPVVTVRDNQGRGLSGIAVTFTLLSGGTVERQSAITSSDGSASAGTWTLGAAPAEYRLSASVARLAPVTFTAQGRFKVTLIAEQAVGASGATITYAKPGDPLDGLSLTIPAGAYSSSGTWRLEARSATSMPPIEGKRASGSVITITTEHGYADEVLSLRIPVRTGADSLATAFLYDSATGYLEPLPVAGRDAGSITVVSRHFSRAQLPTARRVSARGIGAADFGETLALSIVTITEVPTLLNGGPVSAPFEVGNDEWEFPNYGSYITPAGHVTGHTISQLRYYTHHRDPLNLASSLGGRFDTGPFWADNAQGYRVAALSELAVHWEGALELLATIDALATQFGINPDHAHLVALGLALVMSRTPQLVMLSNGSLTIGLLAFEASMAGITVANPSDPGHPLLLPYANGRFQPVQVELIRGVPTTFTSVRVMGLSAIADVDDIDRRFSQMAAGHAGVEIFPTWSMQYFDEDGGAWKELTGTSLNVSWSDVRLRVFCSSCARHLPNANPPGLTALDVYDDRANQLGSDRAAGRVDFSVKPGQNRIGLHILGGTVESGASTTVWRHVDFKYVDINYTRVFVTPDPVSILQGDQVTLTANLSGLPTAPYRYLWSFGDNTPGVAIDGDNTATHTYTTPGTYETLVIVRHPVTNLEVGRARSTVLVDQPVPIWRITSWKVKHASGPAASESHDLTMLNFDAMLYDPLLGRPDFGLLLELSESKTVGNVTYVTGMHLQVSQNGLQANGLDPAHASRSLARPPSTSYYPNQLDQYETSGPLTSGVIRGKGVNNFWDSRNCAGPGPIVPWIWWEIESVKNGTTLTGTVKRTHRITQFGGAPLPCLVEFKGFVGDLIQEWNFTAVRLK